MDWDNELISIQLQGFDIPMEIGDGKMVFKIPDVETANYLRQLIKEHGIDIINKATGEKTTIYPKDVNITQSEETAE